MYQIFEIALNSKKIELEKILPKAKVLRWFSNGPALVKEDDGLQYILDLSNFTLRCVISELFPIDEGKWLPVQHSSREDLVNTALSELQKLGLNLEVVDIIRVVKHV